ncbi:MAG: hypothetical protein ACYDBV_08660 [Nitrospiria bacterium]
MDKISISEPSEEIIKRVEEGLAANNEPYGYDWWWELRTIDGKTYKITEQMKELIAATSSKFITLPKGEVVATHQITGIRKESVGFGPRAGEA